MSNLYNFNNLNEQNNSHESNYNKRPTKQNTQLNKKSSLGSALFAGAIGTYVGIAMLPVSLTFGLIYAIRRTPYLMHSTSKKLDPWVDKQLDKKVYIDRRDIK